MYGFIVIEGIYEALAVCVYPDCVRIPRAQGERAAGVRWIRYAGMTVVLAIEIDQRRSGCTAPEGQYSCTISTFR